MADEYWALGAAPAFWDTATLGKNLTGITFSIVGVPAGTVYNGFSQTTANNKTYLRATIADSATVFTMGEKTSTGSFNFAYQNYRAIIIHSIETGSTAYEWVKSATGGKGVKYDFMQDLMSLDATDYRKLSTGVDSTTKITAKANGYAPNSNTATWRKGS